MQDQQQPNNEPARPPKRRRKRINRSCEECKLRHHFCDRARPTCSSCRHLERACFYPESADTSRSASPSSRLTHLLPNLVLSPRPLSPKGVPLRSPSDQPDSSSGTSSAYSSPPTSPFASPCHSPTRSPSSSSSLSSSPTPSSHSSPSPSPPMLLSPQSGLHSSSSAPRIFGQMVSASLTTMRPSLFSMRNYRSPSPLAMPAYNSDPNPLSLSSPPSLSSPMASPSASPAPSPSLTRARGSTHGSYLSVPPSGLSSPSSSTSLSSSSSTASSFSSASSSSFSSASTTTASSSSSSFSSSAAIVHTLQKPAVPIQIPEPAPTLPPHIPPPSPPSPPSYLTAPQLTLTDDPLGFFPMFGDPTATFNFDQGGDSSSSSVFAFSGSPPTSPSAWFVDDD